MTCKTCKSRCAWAGQEASEHGKCLVGYTPMTNADRIRAMSDEELAETYAGGCPNGDRLKCGKYYLHGGRDCFRCWLDWLKSPVEEVDNGT